MAEGIGAVDPAQFAWAGFAWRLLTVVGVLCYAFFFVCCWYFAWDDWARWWIAYRDEWPTFTGSLFLQACVTTAAASLFSSLAYVDVLVRGSRNRRGDSDD